jgi:hypothetical protein
MLVAKKEKRIWEALHLINRRGGVVGSKTRVPSQVINIHIKKRGCWVVYEKNLNHIR